MVEGGILDRLDAQEKRLSTMPLGALELDQIRRARHLLYVSAVAGSIIGTVAGAVMTLGKHNSRLTKSLIISGSASAGFTLGTAFGVQTGMRRLLQLDGPLGEELRRLEMLRSQLRKRGVREEEGPFRGPAVEAERQLLSSMLCK